MLFALDDSKYIDLVALDDTFLDKLLETLLESLC